MIATSTPKRFYSSKSGARALGIPVVTFRWMADRCGAKYSDINGIHLWVAAEFEKVAEYNRNPPKRAPTNKGVARHH